MFVLSLLEQPDSKVAPYFMYMLTTYTQAPLFKFAFARTHHTSAQHAFDARDRKRTSKCANKTDAKGARVTTLAATWLEGLCQSACHVRHTLPRTMRTSILRSTDMLVKLNTDVAIASLLVIKWVILLRSLSDSCRKVGFISLWSDNEWEHHLRTRGILIEKHTFVEICHSV